MIQIHNLIRHLQDLGIPKWQGGPVLAFTQYDDRIWYQRVLQIALVNDTKVHIQLWSQDGLLDVHISEGNGPVAEKNVTIAGVLPSVATELVLAYVFEHEKLLVH